MEERILRFVFGKMSKDEKNDFFEEMETNPRLKQEVIKVHHNYSVAEMLDMHTDTEYANRKLKELKQQLHKIQTRKKIIRTLKYAAIILFLIGIGMSITRLTNYTDEINYHEYKTEAGKRQEIILPDGTKTFLGPSSVMRVKFNSGNRTVELNGQAMFDVVSDSKRPFTVQTGKYNIRVLGTVFSITAYSKFESFETTLMEGSLSVFNEQEEITLAPNEAVAIIDGKLKKKSADFSEMHYLESGTYSFDEATLTGLLNKISMWYGVDFDITDKELSKKTITGKLRENDDVGVILMAIRQLCPFEYKKCDNEKFIIY